ncbi:MAG TPA: helix-turn-helix transcriptional regulator [Candidatus Ruania gallistercoris]|uniref:Helix-turn-helix transcriptional regulator n=1 Tax=Candidatus Ruania gallistercoris TaxID=2838746 RepID=A0A9D2EFR1_9MICO|nr:helix-turn-helix transcriptional regulator [Candidatus Ruania gallistercoris]
MTAAGPQDQNVRLTRAVAVIGRPWTLLIVDRLSAGSLRFSEIVASLPGISTNLLSERLRTLGVVGITQRVAAGSVSNYQLTDLGHELKPIITALENWGARLPD